MPTIVIYFVLALAGSLALTPVCRWAAVRSGCVARPKEDRWHQRPTALFGGIAIVAVTLGLATTLNAGTQLRCLTVCGLLLASFGFVDDVLSLKASTKLIVQVTVASLLLFFGFRLQWTESMIGDAMLTLFWIVGVTNAFNLLDNMDGLCAGTALVAGAFLLIGIIDHLPVTAPALYLSALLGATLGFLAYNFYPASIFMGDTGSLFLGVNLAALMLMAHPGSSGRSGVLSVVFAPVLLLLVPIFDTTLVTALRLLSGRSPSHGGRDHSSHRLVAVGLSEPRAVTTLWMIAAAGGAISLVLQQSDRHWAAIATATLLVSMILFGVYLARIRVYADGDLALLKSGAITPLVADFMYKRRVAEVLLDSWLIPLAYYSAYRLRFEGNLLQPNYRFFIQSLPVVLGAQLLSLFVVGGYRGTWRYFGIMDAVVFGKSVLLGTVASVLIILYLYRFESYSRSVFVIYAAVLFLLLSGSRASLRLVGEFVFRRSTQGLRCIIYGVSGASLATIREAFGDQAALRILGYVDDESANRNLRFSGYSVLGTGDDLRSMIERDEVDCVILNGHLIAAERLQRLETLCAERDVELLRLQIHMKRLYSAS